MGQLEQSVDKSIIYPPSPEEKQWVRLVRQEGDRTAFEKIFRTYYRRLQGFAYGYVKQVDKAEDIVQTVFLKIWAQRESWNPPGTVKQYLFNAVRNEALNVLRHDQIVERSEEEVTHMFLELKRSAYFEKDPEVEELRAAIQIAIDRLPQQCRKIFVLSRRSGLTYSEIADVLDISVNTVGTQMGRALKFLRHHLSDFLPLLAAIEMSRIFFV